MLYELIKTSIHGRKMYFKINNRFLTCNGNND